MRAPRCAAAGRADHCSSVRPQRPVSISGIIEGFKEEKASLQEALCRQETAEHGLAEELEGLRQQLQQAAQQQAELKEENSALWSQKEASAAEAEAREAGESGACGAGQAGALRGCALPEASVQIARPLTALGCALKTLCNVTLR